MRAGTERIPFVCHSHESGNPVFFLDSCLRRKDNKGAAAAGLAFGVASGQAGLPAVGKGGNFGLAAKPVERFVHFQRSGRSVAAEGNWPILLGRPRGRPGLLGGMAECLPGKPASPPRSRTRPAETPALLPPDRHKVPVRGSGRNRETEAPESEGVGRADCTT